MNRYPEPGFDPRIADWLEADPDLAPPDLMRTVDAALPSIPQRRAMRLPWRFPPMSTFAKVAIAAVAVIAVGTVGILALQPRSTSTVGAAPTASPSSSPSPSPSPSASATPTEAPSSPPPLGQTFSSPRNGISISYPDGWKTSAATKPFTMTGWPSFLSPEGDFLYDRLDLDHLFIAIASQPIGERTAQEWAAATLASDECTPAAAPITVDGATGLIGDGCDMAAVALDGRGYVIVLYTSDDVPGQFGGYDRAWFEQVLATVDLRPADAVDAAPSP